MTLADELAQLFRRDLTRLLQELKAFSGEEDFWRTLPGVNNSAGNLALHVEGNLLEYVGRQLGHVPYNRQRNLEFSGELPATELVERIATLQELIPRLVAGLSEAELESTYPEQVFGGPLSTQQLLISLHGHLTYHLGQMDYLRRILTQGKAIEFAGL